ncbi:MULTISPECIES: GAF domain-containing protein [unclassified Coleofasciculus]|uniref:GAF domain-containing protein n=1 Tax=unclassified Coleofasciculus TaxID=2692782 RepID=UPI00187FD702|nr:MULTISPECIES: GAF domain-containing protein [unclassified Coleofasciculus]MBE9125676.1 GAF domain-containing protein [Coleofasciculus sp. LEGE 07081]MBE9148831.1 GAF domain-containing protein [Coleofasciculus sp. LEGE 07092]
MSDRDKSKEQLIQELALLRREVTKLKTAKIAFEAQHHLLRTFITTLQTARGTLMVRAMLQQIVNVAQKLTGAEGTSLFLLDINGIVTESILARGATLRGQKQRLIGQVLDKGLAGWVFRHHQVGLVTDTQDDPRWLTLPNQPYTVRSALGIPILMGKEILAILTLMHSQPDYFRPDSARLMQMMAEPIALVLDNARLYNELQQKELELHPIPTDGKVPNIDPQPSDNKELSLMGMYILFGEGNFLYVSPRLAEIFGYTFGELVSLESVLELVFPNNRKFVAQQLKSCIQGHNKNLCCKFQGQRKDRSPIGVEVYGTRTKLYGKFVIIGGLRAI